MYRLTFVIFISILIISFISVKGNDSTVIKNIPFDKETKVLLEDRISSFDNTNDDQNNKKLFDHILKYDSLIGACIGSLFAGLIAVFTVYFTNKNNIRLEGKKIKTQLRLKESIYNGLLYSIYIELIGHDKINKLLLDEIYELLSFVSDTKKIPDDDPFTKFPTDFLIVCRNKILDYEKYDTSNLADISFYINEIVRINNHLNLSKINTLYEKHFKEENLFEGMKDYFDLVIKNLNDKAKFREDMMSKIVELIRLSPDSYLIETEKKTNNK